MARRRTGSLSLKIRNGQARWFAQVTVDLPDGGTRRDWYSLETDQKPLAKRKLARLVASLNANKTPAEAAATAGAPETFKEFATAWVEDRIAAGKVCAPDEKGYLAHAMAIMGPLPVASVTSAHVQSVLDELVRQGYARASIVHVRGVIHRVFKKLWILRAIGENPVDRTEIPEMVEQKKDRVILTDQEVDALLACPEVSPEMKMLSLCARCEGGMRSGDLNRWKWEMIDRESFAVCLIPRSKTKNVRPPQKLPVPELVRPFLRAWWHTQGSPVAGPVFPVQRGVNAGKFKAARGTSYAKRLRRELHKALVWAKIPIRLDLFNETDWSKPVDFHSFRRAYKTGLAVAGVSSEKAMHLSGSTDPRVHARYIMATAEMGEVPAAALPVLQRAAANASSIIKNIRGAEGDRTPDLLTASQGDIHDSPSFVGGSGDPGTDEQPSERWGNAAGCDSAAALQQGDGAVEGSVSFW